jgi:hypothetical protein
MSFETSCQFFFEDFLSRYAVIINTKIHISSVAIAAAHNIRSSEFKKTPPQDIIPNNYIIKNKCLQEIKISFAIIVK